VWDAQIVEFIEILSERWSRSRPILNRPRVED
jgi:hypothetical protein